MARHPTVASPESDSSCAPIPEKPNCENIRIDLENVDMWKTFTTGVVNEMIITKSGRKLFPIMQLKVRGLDTQRMYSVVMDFQQKGQNRWKFCDGGWTHAGKAEPAPTDTAYVHTRSPNYGHVWMSDPIDFSKIKVTNKATKDMIRLNSLHLYEPRVRIYKVDPQLGGELLLAEKTFPICAFMAVTSYQNEEVTVLKVKHNPFAKGFQDNRLMKRLAQDSSMPTEYGMNPPPNSDVLQGWNIPSHEIPIAEPATGPARPCSNSAHLTHRYSPYNRRAALTDRGHGSSSLSRGRELPGQNHFTPPIYGNNSYMNSSYNNNLDFTTIPTTSGAGSAVTFSAVNDQSSMPPSYQTYPSYEASYNSFYASYGPPPPYNYTGYYNGLQYSTGNDTSINTFVQENLPIPKNTSPIHSPSTGQSSPSSLSDSSY